MIKPMTIKIHPPKARTETDARISDKWVDTKVEVIYGDVHIEETITRQYGGNSMGGRVKTNRENPLSTVVSLIREILTGDDSNAM